VSPYGPPRHRRHPRALTLLLILLGIAVAVLLEAFVWAGTRPGRDSGDAIMHAVRTMRDPDAIALLRFGAGALAGFLAAGMALRHSGALNLARMLATGLILMVGAALGAGLGLATYAGLMVTNFGTTWADAFATVPDLLAMGDPTVWGLAGAGGLLGVLVTAVSLGTEAVQRIGRGSVGLFVGGTAGLTIYGLAYLAVHYPRIPDSIYYFLYVGEAIYSFSPLEFFFVGLGALVGLLIARNTWRFYGVATFVSMIAVILGFLGYSFFVTLPAVERPWYGLAVLLFIAESFTLVMVVLYAFYTIDVSARKRWRKVPEDAPHSKYFLPRVAFQVCVFNEPTDLVLATLGKLRVMNYPQDRYLIMVLDDSTREELIAPLKDYCQKNGLVYLHRTDRRGYKAGALNDSLQHVPADVDLLAVVDADYQIEPEFLKETAGYFVNPNLGWLQTPQDYRNRNQSFLTEQYYLADAYFYRTVMPSRNEENTIIFCGTMGIVRKQALLEVGRWGEKYISEDAELSIRLLTHGWESLYINKTFGRGLIPATFEAYKKQHYRWAFGGAKILRGHFWDIALGRLTPRQSFDYFVGSAHWFEGLFIVFISWIIAALAFSELLGFPIVTHHSREILLIGLIPFFLLTDGFTRLHMVMRERMQLSFGRTLRVLGMWMSVKFSNSFGALKSFVGFNMPFIRTKKAPNDRVTRGEALRRSLRVAPFESGMAALLLGLFLATLWRLWATYDAVEGRVPATRLFLAFWLLYYTLVFFSAPFYAYKAYVTFTPDDELPQAAPPLGTPRPVRGA
jgi:cellulose synthase/poly-beta-1,6-N-acetylglucosamine synthase-like glycosyltransferase